MIVDPDVEAFRLAWMPASQVIVSERPDATVQKALEVLAAGVRKRIRSGSTIDAAVKPFQQVIGTGSMTSDPRSLGAWAFRDGDRLLVDVRMGFASSVKAYDAYGRAMTLPPPMEWSYRYAGSFLRTGPLVAFNATSLQDAGVRYGYRLQWLRRTSRGYASAGFTKGFWTLAENEEDHFSVRSSRVIAHSLEEPMSFFVTSPVRLLRRTETWMVQGSSAKRTGLRFRDRDIRAIDAWLWKHRGERLKGGQTVPPEKSLVDDIERGKGWIGLRFDDLTLRFELAAKGEAFRVRRVTAL